MKKTLLTVVSGMLVMAVAAMAEQTAPAASTNKPAKAAAPAKAAKAQTKCPITGEKIDKALSVEVNDFKIYVCCKDCIEKIKANPTAALAKIVGNGETPELVKPLCDKCGQVKGSELDCKEGAEKCPGCKLAKDSPGCMLHCCKKAAKAAKTAPAATTAPAAPATPAAPAAPAAAPAEAAPAAPAAEHPH
ncbi:MAG: hypothetical protein HY343_09240 [Lentisphaerae bacterium]|nr:hypothetical protein [Lentisphaerota bacterium]